MASSRKPVGRRTAEEFSRNVLEQAREVEFRTAVRERDAAMQMAERSPGEGCAGWSVGTHI